MTFDDVISQQHITDTLKNQIISGKTAHAYLFTGSRGTGKTTCARILAKAVNCRCMHGGNPCLECDICRDADSGALTDIIEIDAASNNGVNDIRDLRDGAVYTPERGAYKIYIIDEVHMLSPSAFNALLKIMEEPPPYVKFILATTEIQKVPATIASRCQRYDFRRIRSEDISSRLMYIAEQEGLNLTPDGAALIARTADGGMRDAVSLLDQCSVCTDVIDAEAVSSAAGIAGRDYIYEIIENVSDGNISAAAAVVSRLYDMSKDLSVLCDEIIVRFRDIMLIKVSPQTADGLIICLPDELVRLKAIAEKTDIETIMYRLSVLQDCRERMNRVMNKRVEFEMSLIRLCSNTPVNTAGNTAIDNSEIYDKIKQLENRISSIGRGVTEKPEILTAQSPDIENEPVPAVDIRKIRPEDIKKCDKWDEILARFAEVNPAVAGSLDGSTADMAANVLFVTVQNRFFMELFRNKENAASLRKVIAEIMGKPYALRAKCSTTKSEQKSLAEQLIRKAMDSRIETAVEE
jgi:DNA polymerase-3 subunit gamma/tau